MGLGRRQGETFHRLCQCPLGAPQEVLPKRRGLLGQLVPPERVQPRRVLPLPRVAKEPHSNEEVWLPSELKAGGQQQPLEQ